MGTSTRQISIPLGVFAMVAACVASVYAQPHDLDSGQFSAQNTPNRVLAIYYEKNKSEIEKLTAATKDESASPDARVESLNQLHLKYPDPAVAVSIDLVKDKSTPVAARAAQILADSAAMMGHRANPNGELSPVVKFLMAKHSAVEQALRGAISDKRTEVRTPAAELLAAQSDPQALAQIAKAAQNGTCSDAEAAKYFSLADPAKSGQYLSAYLDKSGEAQQLATDRLSYVPQYKSQVSKVLWNENAALGARKAAAKGLSNDPTIAHLILHDPAIPSSIKEVSAESYLDAKGKDLSADELESFKRILQDVQRQQPNAQLKATEQKVDRLHQERSR